MESLLISLDVRDPVWIVIAFAFGLLVKHIGLPPMVGFLLAGFALHSLGAEGGAFLQEVADLGVTLLLFTIGLKLRIGRLARSEIWGTTTIHMTAMVGVASLVFYCAGAIGLPLFKDLDVRGLFVVAFALSFSSTVFAVKTLEDRGAMAARYGQVAIGILVLQDVAAVVFLAVSTGKIPTLWAIGLLALIPGRHFLGYLLARCGHQELMTVFGFAMAIGGATLFEITGMKGDLGALFLGVLLAQHPKASELSKNLMGFKDVFLVCFFLVIGFNGFPTAQSALAGLAVLILLPLKMALFFLLLAKFRLRARSAAVGACILGNYSEFGLIVATVAISVGWLPQEWLVVIAVALAASFIVSSPVNIFADALYVRFQRVLLRAQTSDRLPGDENIPLQGNRVLVFGMGRVGRAAYDEMRDHLDDHILGIDLDEDEVKRNVDAGRRVVQGDATHPDFWLRLDKKHEEIEMILLAMPNQMANLNAAKNMRERGFTGPIVATALYPDQEDILKENGVDQVFNLYAEAGIGAASRMWQTMKAHSFAG